MIFVIHDHADYQSAAGYQPAPQSIITEVASPPPRSDRKNPYLRIHAVNIFVRDQERSLRFYVDQLGFDLAFDAQLQSGDRWVAVAPPDGSAVLSLIAPKPDPKRYGPIARSPHVVFPTLTLPPR